MRNARWILLAAVAAGCASTTNPQSRQELHAGYQALGEQNYDGAMNHAEAFLRDHPNGGPGTAEALYLQGRVYEQRATVDDSSGRAREAQQDLQYGRETYEHALTLPASVNVQALIHAGVANCAYFQDDYAAAMDEWAKAYDGITQPDARAWMLYRIGLCQQRLGRFEQADHSFALCRQQFPGSVPAQRAVSHQGARAFYVQVGAFAERANADKIVASLRSQGYRAERKGEASGRQAVRVGPAYNYADAKTLQSRLLSAYPGALIEP
ncbi:MAG TPA: SPOR domain-containing protein [Tepidisphaeraceae bacterium]|nr:SPOR domain-containing protein [Tepidisphaeraceae bacterium]